ncbi:hypothetical protein DENSPDRAFT_583822 [Dentipellis sp. KUC8613]|nr:hypothetical protein DENSPDRAFT_583822 [Dentipellis sp. KUC8613]
MHSVHEAACRVAGARPWAVHFRARGMIAVVSLRRRRARVARWPGDSCLSRSRPQRLPVAALGTCTSTSCCQSWTCTGMLNSGNRCHGRRLVSTVLLRACKNNYLQLRCYTTLFPIWNKPMQMCRSFATALAMVYSCKCQTHGVRRFRSATAAVTPSLRRCCIESR